MGLTARNTFPVGLQKKRRRILTDRRVEERREKSRVTVMDPMSLPQTENWPRTRPIDAGEENSLYKEGT